MRKITSLCLICLLALVLGGCGGQDSSENSSVESSGSAYAQPVDVLQAVWDSLSEEERFASYGGDREDPVMDGPGTVDVGNVEALDMDLGLPESLAGKIEGAASLIHMMNANTFTAAVYALKPGEDMEAFSEELEQALLDRQWICGQPSGFFMLDADGTHLLCAFGDEQILSAFQDQALTVFSGSKLLREGDIA